MMTEPAAPSPLGPDDPPPFEVFNPDGRAPVLLLCDHASARLPSALGTLGVPAALMGEHIAWDIGAAVLTRRLSALLDAPAVLCCYSRLLIDCNRQPGDPTAIPAVSDHTSVPGNQSLSEAEEQARTDAVFWPYHRAIGDTLAHLWRRLQDGLAPAVVSLHTFTPCMRNGQPRPWHAGLLWNRDPRLVVPLLKALQADPALCVGDNEPYNGRQVNYTLDVHAGAAGLPHVAVEVRQDLVADDAGADAWAHRLADALRPVLGDPHIHSVTHF